MFLLYSFIIICYSYRTISGNLYILITNLKSSQTAFRHSILRYATNHYSKKQGMFGTVTGPCFGTEESMNKKWMALAVASAAVFGTCMVAAADGKVPVATRDLLHSSGRIVYEEADNRVVLDTQDLYEIADRLDLFKTAVSNQLASMHTYLTRGDGLAMQTDNTLKVTHVNPPEEYRVDPLTVDFGTLIEGVAASQSVPAEPAAYGYETGITLYRTAEGSLTTEGDEEGCEAVVIQPATADNLSAGTAAWVDGHLLLGTGADSQSYYEKGHGQTSETITNIISLLYSGVNETREYAVTGKDGGSLSVSIDSKVDAGPNRIKISSEQIPVWNLEGEEKRLLTKMQFRVDSEIGGGRDDDGATVGTASIEYVVYDQNGQAVGSGYGDATSPLVIDAMALPITTQYIYVEAAGNVSVYTSGHGHDHGTAYITFHNIQATYLIN